ncbi:NADPH:quinone oxidoreductase family protein [Roseospira marina]|uniref:NADPH:quinone oxidoreductase family protein n=1 Tax=Roseospira marina TaxID=140057 RepID=A0A5M6IFJ6_9PROT|nr:NADPH:quinone oxidoreductase family protein [Roseospira marina]KAA5606902.1 NADPH:quinone oxidoreductase family protein [Roseospira marina]MBB4312927.1 NADPH2:quinone reductase [Roseospira marina]MBB5086300.1 NADPH2:quinone reductase [Roseospira marina]
MRAAVCHAYTSHRDLRVEDIPPPPMISGGVRIRVSHAGLNFADSLITAGQYQEKPTPPFVPGFELAGTVTEVADGVTAVAVGDRVMAMPAHGAFAEEAVVPEASVWPLGDGMSPAVGAAFPIAYGTAHFGLFDRARLQPGEVVLIHGAAGGVGLTAVECAKAGGATVIATASGPEKLAVAAEHGADHGIDARTEDIRARVLALTDGRGADVVYDPVGGPVFDASLRCTAPDGRLLAIGFASGTVPQIPANRLLVKNQTVIGFYWGAYLRIAPERVRACMAALVAWHDTGMLRPRVSAEFALEDVVSAIDALVARRVTGKAVLRMA